MNFDKKKTEKSILKGFAFVLINWIFPLYPTTIDFLEHQTLIYNLVSDIRSWSKQEILRRTFGWKWFRLNFKWAAVFLLFLFSKDSNRLSRLLELRTHETACKKVLKKILYSFFKSSEGKILWSFHFLIFVLTLIFF